MSAIPVEIERLSHDGRGVAHCDGKAVLVSGAIPGERVLLRLWRRHRSYDEAELGEVVTASPTRIAPPCPHFGVCGGCSLQHLDPPMQLALKEELLIENLRRLAGITARSVRPAISGPPYGYRRRARFSVRYLHARRRAVVGFRESNGRFVTDARVCPALVAPWEALPGSLADLTTGLRAKTRLPQIELAAGDGAAALVFRFLDEPEPNDIARLGSFGRDNKLAIWIQPGGRESLRLVQGAPLLGYALPDFDVTLHFLPIDFVQINALVNRSLVAAAVDLLKLEAEQRVLELYSGIGNFSLALARRAARVVSVEGDAVLVNRARANAAANGLGNLEQCLADLDAPNATARWLAGNYDAVLLDPPRSGARLLIPELRRLRPARVVYVSCHPATLARDAADLVGVGYRLESIGIADMFPQTTHAEAIALFVTD